MPGYTKVQFLGWAVNTTPKGAVLNEDTDRLEGTYTGMKTAVLDINNRVGLMQEALDTAFEKAVKDPLCLKIFMAPEFLFRGRLGAYRMREGEYTRCVAGLAALASKPKWKDWLFCFGTVVGMSFPDTADAKIMTGVSKAWDTAMKTNKALVKPPAAVFASTSVYLKHFETAKHPVEVQFTDHFPVEIYNTAIVMRGGANAPTRIVMKRSLADADFIEYSSGLDGDSTKGVKWSNVTQPPKILKPDGKPDTTVKPEDGIVAFPNDPDPTLKKTVFGVEVCADHTVGLLSKAGKTAHIQLIPACGLARPLLKFMICPKDGFVFCVDGDADPGAEVFQKVNDVTPVQLPEAKWKSFEGPKDPTSTFLVHGGGKVRVLEPQTYPAV